MLLNIYRQLRGPVFSIALGDSPNDISMLEVVDKAVLMQGKHCGHVNGLVHPDLIKTEGSGPGVWNKVILSFLADFGYSNFPAI